ncbi:P-loop containing nucleoside triphosphate hydrolase protein [Cylindrobasidium torrendii FP15055 ss-10]|uniref:DNA 3'-5' helicase n=1 Tax=Cylindrobasidium torrendii FP15055 ss-10 TaxID=1314674 RepID=A0A0D7AW21_9AGAR|nr:P-loop containing nucleoside triphosphate hydrolase protein [Cylindrobasidium torrendii FP15055 ss-10]
MKRKSPQSEPILPPPHIPTNEELKNLGELCQQKWGWQHKPRDAQVAAMTAQLQGRDVCLHAYTGFGKTCVAAGPFAHPAAEGRVSIMVSPLIALQDEMVNTFRDEYKLNAIAINSSHGGCSPEALQKIIDGEYQIILISPELLLSRRFSDIVMRNSTFTRKVLSVIVDEAHVVSHWGADFRKLYGGLGQVRGHLPPKTSIVAMSATLSGRVKRDVLSKLDFDKRDGQDGYVDIDVGNDRPNVSLVVRSIEHPMNTYRDLDFVIPKGINKPDEIPLTWVYADSIAQGTEIEDHLNSLLPTHLRSMGLVRPYNAAHSKEYRAAAMQAVREGQIRVLVCTDAAGMGCNIPNIDVVVQWKLPGTVSSFVQRAGRAARGLGRVGLAVLLVERAAFNTDLWEVSAEEESTAEKTKGKGKAKTGKAKRKSKLGGSGGRDKKVVKQYAISRGLERGWISGMTDTIWKRDQPPCNAEATDEGLLVLVQTGVCRRLVLKGIYHNDTIAPTAECCDLCCPKLLDRTRPGPFKKASRRTNIKKGDPQLLVQVQLQNWRQRVKKEHFPNVPWGASGILCNKTVDLLASVGPFKDDRAKFDRVLAGQWKWATRYADDLFKLLAELDIPELPESKATRKRKAPIPTSDEGLSNPSRMRQRRNAHTVAALANSDTQPQPSAQAMVQRQDVHVAGSLMARGQTRGATSIQYTSIPSSTTHASIPTTNIEGPTMPSTSHPVYSQHPWPLSPALPAASSHSNRPHYAASPTSFHHYAFPGAANTNPAAFPYNWNSYGQHAAHLFYPSSSPSQTAVPSSSSTRTSPATTHTPSTSMTFHNTFRDTYGLD